MSSPENPRVAGSIPAPSTDDDPNSRRGLGFFISGVVADRSHPAQIQRHVFSLIDRADAVTLSAPSGRVGLSAAMEVGNALRAQTASGELAMDWLTRRFP